MDAPKIANAPDRYLVTEVELVNEGPVFVWVDEECAGCGEKHCYPAGNYRDDPRRKLGYHKAPCAKPEPGTPLAIAAEAINLNLGVLLLIDADEAQTADLLKVATLMEFAGLMECPADEDEVCAGIEGVLA